jgi:hypothetical protein
MTRWRWAAIRQAPARTVRWTWPATCESGLPMATTSCVGGAFGVDAGEIACTARFEFIVDSALRGVGFRVAAPVP